MDLATGLDTIATKRTVVFDGYPDRRQAQLPVRGSYVCVASWVRGTASLISSFFGFPFSLLQGVHLSPPDCLGAGWRNWDTLVPDTGLAGCERPWRNFVYCRLPGAALRCAAERYISQHVAMVVAVVGALQDETGWTAHRPATVVGGLKRPGWNLASARYYDVWSS